MSEENTPKTIPFEEIPMGDLIQTSTGYQLTPFLGLTAAKAAALVAKQVG